MGFRVWLGLAHSVVEKESQVKYTSIILTARSNAGQPNSGVGLELDTITAAALGGVALSGGKGTTLGAVLGVIVLGVLQNGMILLNVSQFYQFIAKGALLILAVLLQRWLKKG